MNVIHNPPINICFSIRQNGVLKTQRINNKHYDLHTGNRKLNNFNSSSSFIACEYNF